MMPQNQTNQAQQQQRRTKPTHHRRRHRQRLQKQTSTINDTFDWSKYTNFQLKKTGKDLRKLLDDCLRVRKMNGNELKELLEQPDETGLCPIHWASINNRADLLAEMFASCTNINLLKACENKLLSNGTGLHLAAINGSLEVAELLLKNQSDNSSQTKIEQQQVDSSSQRQQRTTSETNLLNIRDLDGQTALMRTATPKSKRMNLLYDLLRKNFWSLSGRPAEMALYLIGRGANWRDTEPKQNMNLLHLAIINDYDDIVNLLLVIDIQLVNCSINLKDSTNTVTAPKTAALIRVGEEQEEGGEEDEEEETLPLVDKNAKVVENLLGQGIKPLELAIVYRRVSIIYLLWFIQSKSSLNSRESNRNERELIDENLKSTLFKACFTNKDELVKFLKPLLFRVALKIDFGLYFLNWVPLSLHHNRADRFVFCSFMLSIIMTLAFTFRAMIKDPGYLRANSVQYLGEIAHILAKRNDQNSERKRSEDKKEERGKPIDLIKRQNKEVIVRQSSSSTENRPNISPGARENNSILTRILVPEESVNRTDEENNSMNNGDLIEKVRLLCHKCRCIRRPRSRHCDYCNQCVQDFDHHCIYLGCCIGQLNRFDFFIAMTMLTVSSIYGTIIYSNSSYSSSTWSFWHFVGFIWVFKYVLIGGINAFIILRRACLGVTMYEEIRAKRISSSLGQESIDAHRKRRMWRFPSTNNNKLLTTNGLSLKQMSSNFFEFANSRGFDEYLFELFTADTPLARSIANKNSRINMYKFV